MRKTVSALVGAEKQREELQALLRRRRVLLGEPMEGMDDAMDNDGGGDGAAGETKQPAVDAP